MAHHYKPIPTTISREAQKLLNTLHSSPIEASPDPEDTQAWQERFDAKERRFAQSSIKALESTKIEVKEISLAAVPILELTPLDWQSDNRLLIYLHGGAFTSFSARSQLPSCAPLTACSRLKTLAIDYSLAPQAKWQFIHQQILDVFQALLDSGYSPNSIGIYGDSAGGNLALASALNIRDCLRVMPGALVLWSPWADLSNSGDTAETLKDFDPVLNYDLNLASAARAFAGERSLTDPSISPLYADFRKGLSPTLIQESTRTILLSTSVRLYRRLSQFGIDVTIDMYEGLPHGFHYIPLPESELAVRNTSKFFLKHLSCSNS